MAWGAEAIISRKGRRIFGFTASRSWCDVRPWAAANVGKNNLVADLNSSVRGRPIVYTESLWVPGSAFQLSVCCSGCHSIYAPDARMASSKFHLFIDRHAIQEDNNLVFRPSSAPDIDIAAVGRIRPAGDTHRSQPEGRLAESCRR